MNKSYGTQITQDRIELIKQSLNIDAQVRIEDLYNDQGKPAGTRVHLLLPQIDPKSANRMMGADNK